MKLYRIVQDKVRTNDLSGTGAFRNGGRWNSKGTYMLYSSETSSLAYLESLVHFEEGEMPSQLFIIELEVLDDSLVYTVPDAEYGEDWMHLSLHENQKQGDHWMQKRKYVGIRVRSAVNRVEYNCLLNPLFPDYFNLVKIRSVVEIKIDERFTRISTSGRKRR